MNKTDRGKLIGMILGDGHIKIDKRVKKANTGALVICHSAQQEEYCNHKAEVIRGIFGGNFSVGKYNHFLPSTGKEYPQCRFSKGNSYFRILHNWIYREGKKTISRKILDMLTPEGIAYWYMDDGSCVVNARNKEGGISSVRCNLHTCCSKEEAQTVCDYFAETWGITFKVFKEKANYSVRVFTDEARKLQGLITGHIIPSMQYKFKHLIAKSAQPSQEVMI
jgi:hypothetical protein